MPDPPNTPRRPTKYISEFGGIASELKCADCPYYPGNEWPKTESSFFENMLLIGVGVLFFLFVAAIVIPVGKGLWNVLIK